MKEINVEEIDLGELFSALISGWKTLFLSTLVFFIGSVYYAMNGPEEKFESVAKIQFVEGSSRSQFSDFSGIASLAGINIPNNLSNQLHLETRLTARKFILSLDENVNLFSDKYFNPHLNTQYVNDNFNLERLKSATLDFFTREEASKNESNNQVELSSKIEYQIVKNFRTNLRVDESDGGLIKIFFKHTSPLRSAEILNVALDNAIHEIDHEKKEVARVRLNYLEGELMRIQKELEAAVDAMQKYAVQYNVGSIQDLANSSLRTDSLRDELKLLSDTLAAIDHLSSLDSFTNQDLSEARIKYPFIGTLEFRSRLNLPADINSWAIPLDSTIKAAQSRVSRQIEDLKALISGFEKKARNTATEAKIYGELQRNVTVKETLYEVLIKQFESQSLSAGFPGKSVKFFDPAVPPIEKTEPKRSLIVALGSVLGLFLGSAFVLVRTALTGVIYSRRAILNKTKKLGTLIQLSNVKSRCGSNFLNSLASVKSKIQNYRSLASSIDPSHLICGVVSTHDEANVRCLGLVLMQGMRRYFESVQLVDVNSVFKLGKVNEIDNNLLGRVGSITVDNDCEVLQPHSELNAYELKLYVEKMRQEGTAVVVLFGDLEVKKNEMMFLSGSVDKMFFGVKIKKTKRNHLEVIEEILSKYEKPGAMVYC